ncbi:MAG: hypothetical protein ACXWF8_18075 [Methylobacter sp.]
MQSITKVRKKQWFKISEVIELLNKINAEYSFSEKDVLKNANLYKSKANYPKSEYTSKDNVSLYFFTKNIINASIVNNVIDDDEFCIGNIEFSGYIHLEDRYIEELLDNGETIINGFLRPTQEDSNDRNIFHYYQQDSDFDWSFANVCRILKNERPVILANDICNLLLYKTDVTKLIKRYTKIIAKKDTRVQATEVFQKKRNKPQLKNYKKAAANCLARLIWKDYPDILPKDLSNFWGFHTIHSYKYQTCNDAYLITTFSKDDSETLAQISPCYDTVNIWIKASCPERLTITGRTTTEQEKKSTSSFDKFKSDYNLPSYSFIDCIIRSIESYNSHPIRTEFEGKLDLAEIEERTKNNDQKLKDDEFWALFFKNTGLSLNTLETG